MMKKMVLSVGLATALAIPTGVAVAAAQDDGSTPIENVDRDRDQVRDCDLNDPDTTQLRDRDRDHDSAVLDGTHVRVQERVRHQVQEAADGEAGPLHEGPADGTGSQMGHSGR